jgi:anti-sigma regulatory factor (Ser/Thr protein kinase)
MPCQTMIAVADPSQVGEARRAAVRIGEAAQFGETAQGRLAIIATELGTNLLRHAQTGKLLLQEIQTSCGKAVEILALDSGPGIVNIEQSMRDGYSTAGTAGNGLGAIQRLSDEFDIFSQPQHGTVVFSRVFGQSDRSRVEGEPAWGVISIPTRHEVVCGDVWRLAHADGHFAVMIADGLGHGPFAAEAAEKVAEAFDAKPFVPPGVFLKSAHAAASGTRGAAVAMAHLNVEDQIWKYAGVGNISGTLCSAMQSRGMCSHNGIVGSQLRKVQEFDYPRSDNDLLVMYSDGLQTRWAFDAYPGLATRHPAVIAGVLYRDFERGRDDVTVVVVRLGSFKAKLS